MNYIYIAIASILIFSGLGLVWYLSSMLLYPPRLTCEGLQERYVYCGDPSTQGLEFESVAFKTGDGVTIKGWFIPGSGGGGSCVIMAHGVSGTRRAGMRYAKAFYNSGISVLALDFRYYGESDFEYSSYGQNEKLDIFAAINFLEKEKNINSVGLLGFSGGSAIGIISMSEDSRIQAGVFESAYARYGDVVAETAWNLYRIPRFPLISLALWLFRKRGRIRDIDPINYISRIAPRPVFLVHGTNDDEVHYSNSKKLFEKAGDPKQIWLIEGGNHIEAWNDDPEKAENTVIGFFSENLKIKSGKQV